MAALISPVRRNDVAPGGGEVAELPDNIMSREWGTLGAGADTALLPGPRKGLLAQASTANVFVVRDGGAGHATGLGRRAAGGDPGYCAGTGDRGGWGRRSGRWRRRSCSWRKRGS